jgi:hypothetical protein
VGTNQLVWRIHVADLDGDDAILAEQVDIDPVLAVDPM